MSMTRCMQRNGYLAASGFRCLGIMALAVVMAGSSPKSVIAANISMAAANGSWLNAATWSDNAAPTTTNDYSTAVVGNNFLRTSPVGGTAGGNADFTGNSLTVVSGTKLLYKQVAGQTASINGGGGNLILDGQGAAFNGIQLAPNNPVGAGSLLLDANQLIIASDSTIEAGSTTAHATEARTVVIDAILAGSGNLSVIRQGNNADGNDTDIPTFISIASVGAFTGNILVGRDTRLDFNSDHVFAGSLSLIAGPDDGSGSGLIDLSQLNVDQALSFHTVSGNGAFAASGTYSGASLLALNTALGGNYFLDGGGSLTVLVPEPATMALLGFGAISLLFGRRLS